MRGLRMRERSDGASVLAVGVDFEDGGCSVDKVIGGHRSEHGNVAHRRRDRFDDRAGGCSPFTLARKRAMVLVPTAISTVASNSRMSRSNPPFCRSSSMPSFSGINFA
jgi:hypothetical protein